MGLSLSTRTQPAPITDGGRDIDTDILVTEILLEDIQAFNNTHNKNSRRGPESYVGSQVNTLRNALQQLKDQRSEAGRSRRRKNSQVTVDIQALLKRLTVLAQGELDDHLAALALSRGRPLPAQTEAQKGLADVPDKVKDFLDKSEPVMRAAAKPTSTDCVICGDSIDVSTAFQAPCSHAFCHECVTRMVELGSRDEQLLPLRCCTSILPVGPLLKFVPRKQRATFLEKFREASTPPPQRVYCPKASCSTFLGETPKCANKLTCSKCKTRVCTKCKNAAHPGNDCEQNTLELQVRELAEKKRWQTCPRCKAIVERISGCNYVVCRCGATFCYKCGTRGPCLFHG